MVSKSTRKKKERIDNETHQKYFDNFNPGLYNPKEWGIIDSARQSAAV